MTEVVKIHDKYPGQHIDGLPDLIVKWAEDGPINALESSRIGTVTSTFDDKRPGAHRDYGFLLAYGDRFPGGEKLPNATMHDIAPTIFDLLGVPSPEHFDGKALHDIYEKAVAV